MIGSESCRLFHSKGFDVVGVVEDELLVLHRGVGLAGDAVAQGAVDDGHRHRLALAVAEAEPDTPFTVTAVVDAAMLAGVVIVNCVGIDVVVLVTSTLVGLNVQVEPVGNPLQLKLTVPTNGVPLGAKGATVIVLVVLLPAATLTGLSAPAVTVNSAIAAAHACANAFASGEPSPVTWS